MSTALFERQNEKDSLKYIRAAHYCDRAVRAIAYLMITLSILLTLASIVNKYIPKIFPDLGYGIKPEDGGDSPADFTAKILIVISGVFVIFSIFVGFISNRLDIEGANMFEEYDLRVFKLVKNANIMRAISDSTAQNYASRVRKYGFLLNYYFKSPQETEGKDIYFQRYYNFFKRENRIFHSVKSFFLTLWIGFFVIVVALAFAIDAGMQESVINIFIPALSAFSLIAQGWYYFYEQLRFTQNAINKCEDLYKECGGDPSKLSSSAVMRSLQDALFMYRKMSFTIPGFLVRHHEKRWSREDEIIEKTPQNTPKKPLKNTQKTAKNTQKNAQIFEQASQKADPKTEQSVGQAPQKSAQKAEPKTEQVVGQAPQKTTQKAEKKTAQKTAQKTANQQGARTKAAASTTVQNQEKTAEQIIEEKYKSKKPV